MKPYIWLGVLLCGWLAGCTLSVRTQGVAGLVTWTTTAFDLNSNSALSNTSDRFSFTLVLRETQGEALTFNTITWEVEQTGVDLSGRQTHTGSWTLPVNGQLRQPFVYRIFCPTSAHCSDVGPTTIWHITLEGTDAQGQAVHVAVQAELPWIPPKEGGAIDANQGPGSELPAIDFTVPRLYFPRFSGSE
ncbi:hypothetical protein C2W62_13285 [Candidatus Entotheonella serta]|nr:hypothetical protein C2W62_13285 [Candidatus Entotheonella serta]